MRRGKRGTEESDTRGAGVREGGAAEPLRGRDWNGSDWRGLGLVVVLGWVRAKVEGQSGQRWLPQADPITYFGHRVQVLRKQTGAPARALAWSGQGGVTLLH